jgi:hypothetical protein
LFSSAPSRKAPSLNSEFGAVGLGADLASFDATE